MSTTGTAPTAGAATTPPTTAGSPTATAINIDNTQTPPVSPNPAPAALTSVVAVTLKSPPPAGSTLTFGCTVTDTLKQTSALATATVIIQGLPAVTIAPLTQKVAPGTPIQLTATQTAGGTLASYNWTLQSVETPSKG